MSNGDFASVRVIGGLLPPDLLARVLAGDKDLGGLTGSDYHLPAGESPREAANRAWTYLLGAWSSYRQALANLPEGDPAVGLTREKWLTILFKELGYGRLPTTPTGGIVVDDKAFPVSHLWEATPIHLLGWGVELDKRAKGVPGAAERAPQAMVQELLNRTDQYLWAMLSNGRSVRLLRDSTSLAGQSFVEFDLETMFDGELFSDFVLLYALLHQSRVEVSAEGTVGDCWLERWRTSAAESGTRALGLLRDGVKDAIEALGTGFLQAQGNDLSTRIAEGQLSLEDYHRALLRLVYRLLFLFVTEDRGLLLDPDAGPQSAQRYRDYYSSNRLRTVARKRRGSRHTDLWQGLQLVIDALGREGGRPQIALPGLGGIFDPQPIDVVMGQHLPNEALLTAIRKLSVVHPKGQPPRIVDYRNLGAEELGSIYESLLELVPRHDLLGRAFTLELLAGNDRKTSGSYYTPSSLIDLVLDEALDPLLDEREKDKDPEQALLAMTVCDPACGSGHFLVAAARRIASRLATVRTGEIDPTPADVEAAMHDVVARCIYGVDLNPMAAELAKVSLWLEAMQPGRPLSFLDAHIKVGNALLGTTPRLLADGIPDAAFGPIEGDDKKYASALKKRNKVEREKHEAAQDDLFGTDVLDTSNAHLRSAYEEALAGVLSTTSLSEVHEAERRYRQAQDSPEGLAARLRADTWCSAFVQRQVAGAPAITQVALEDPSPEVEAEVRRLSASFGLFHWHLEFPEVFDATGLPNEHFNGDTGWSGGFSVMVGNPPWERVKLQEQEFFASRDESIAKAANAAARKKRIAALATEQPVLWDEWVEAKRRAEGESHYLRNSGRYPLCGRGDVNTYSVFAELFRASISHEGRMGVVTPTGLATDATTADFFADTLRAKCLVAFYDFENETRIFAGVHHSYRFAVTCMTGGSPVSTASLGFVIRNLADVASRAFSLSADEILLLNPNTGTLPVFRSRRDAEITLGIYRRHPVLIRNNDPNGNAWGLAFATMFHMANDSGLFCTAQDLEARGAQFDGWAWMQGQERWLPLYEAKMISHYDHRFATYAGATQAQLNVGTLPRISESEHDDPLHEPLAQYWVPQRDVARMLEPSESSGWLFGWRNITRANNERTLMTAPLPVAAVAHSFPLVLRVTSPAIGLLAIWSSLACDYIVRQKLSGTNLVYFILAQIAAPTPAYLARSAPWEKASMADWLRPRVLELAFTSYRMLPLARQVGDEGLPFRWIPKRREQIQAELDAGLFHVYGLDRQEVDHVLSSFSVLEGRETKERGEFRTKRLVLERYDAMAEAAASGGTYQTLIDPPPGFGPRHDQSTRPSWMKEER
jgi:hypothetical protein